MISFELPNIIKFPMILIFSIVFLFSYLGVSFFAAIGVLIAAVMYNFLLGLLNAKIWKSMMTMKDTRMNATTEALSNIKMIKFYGWSSTFTNRIAQLRK